MRNRVAFIVLCGLVGTVSAQPQQPVRQASASTSPAPSAIAATVNGQPVTEITVQRALKRIPVDKHAEARKEILDFLVDNVLVEQYLVQQKIVVDVAEVQKRMEEIAAEMKNQKKEMATMMKEMNLSDEEFRTQVAADIRWEKFATTRANDTTLKDMFQKNQMMFDGTMVRARHILITPATGQSADVAKATLQAAKKEILAAGETAIAKLPATADAIAKSQAKAQATEEAFARAAEKLSVCPSKKEGGDLSWFPRAGSMVEPFARAAFALKPYEVSDVVATQFGMHLIMATGRKAGQPVTYDKVKDEVKEVYCGQMREQLCAQLRSTAKINIGGPTTKQ